MKRIMIVKGLLSKTTTAKPTRMVVFAIVVSVVSIGYIMALAILAPEKLAEATAAATDLVCSGCVGTSDIANNAVTSGRIGADQVTSSDIGPGQVFSSDIADVTIVSSDLADSAITPSKLAGGAVKPNAYIVKGSPIAIPPGYGGVATADCAPGHIVTGGGYIGRGMIVIENYPFDGNTWYVSGFNQVNLNVKLEAYALCLGASP